MVKTSVSKTTAATRRKTAPKLPRSVLGAVHAVQDKKAVDVIVLDLRKAGGFTDYFVICTGTNPRQIHAIADSVEETLRANFGERPHLTEGVEKSQWILLDYFNFVVHVFSRECRAFYGLERLWGNAERHEIGCPPSPTRSSRRSSRHAAPPAHRRSNIQPAA